MDLENSKPEPTSPTTSEEAQRSFAKHKDNYEKLRADIAVKMQFLDENRVCNTIFKQIATNQEKSLKYLIWKATKNKKVMLFLH